MIPCQPRAAPKAVVLWSKGTEILVNSSRYEPSPLRPQRSQLHSLSLDSHPRCRTTGCSWVSRLCSILAAE